MLWEFNNNKNATETTKKICSVYGQGIITDSQVEKLLSFIMVILHWGKNLDQDTHQISIKVP